MFKFIRLPWVRIASWALLLGLALAGCRSAGDAPQQVGQPDDRPAGAAAIVASPLPRTPQATPAATATATATPPPSAKPPRGTATALPTATPSPTPTPTPALRRLTEGGCCTQPFWSPDSRRVLYIDRPAPDASLGIWGVDATQPGAASELQTGRIAFYSADLSALFTYAGDETVIERLDRPLGETVVERWTVPAGGRPISVSPGERRIAWQISDDDLPFERRTTQVWVADLDGSDARSVATLPRGGLSGWVSDEVLLLSGRESLDSQTTIVYTLSLTDGATVELARAERPRGLSLSSDGRWLAYFVSLSDDPADNGMWVLRTDGTERRQLERELFGAYQWRDAHRLLVVPFQPQAVYHELWEVDAETGATRRLTHPDVTPFKIANGDWQVSPDGRYVAFVENRDRNIWLLTLAE